jgi:hypothetical protein
MFHIHAPEPSVGRTSFLDIEFVDGVAHVDDLHPERAKALTLHGYTVIEEIVGTLLKDMTVPELRELAKDEGIEIPAKAKKADIIAAIEAAPVRVLTAADAEDAIDPIPGHIDNGDGSFTAPGGILGSAPPFAAPVGAWEAYIPLKPTEA